MANVQTSAPAKTAAKRGRAKKGEEDFKLYFVDTENKEHSRPVTGTKSLKLVDKAGKISSITMDGLPDAVKDQLAFAGLKRYIETPIRKDPTDPIGLAAKTFANLKEGKLVVSEGKKAGRAFDADLWVDVFVRAMEIAVERKVQGAKVPGEAAKKKLKADLEAKTPQERSVKTKAWMANAIFAYAKKEVEAARAKKAVTSADNALAGLEF